jgi:hypothetical protein
MPDKKLDPANDASMALYILGDKLAGNVGASIANGLAGLLFNRDVRPCSPTCEHNQPEQ